MKTNGIENEKLPKSGGTGAGVKEKVQSESSGQSSGKGREDAPGKQARDLGNVDAGRVAKSGVDAGVIEQVQESGREIAAKSLQAIGERTKSTTAGYQSDISSGLRTLADGLKQTSSTFGVADETPLSSAGGRYIADLAEKIEGISDYFERKDAGELIEDVKGFARRNPTVFVGGAFALGFAISRLVRSSSHSSASRGEAK